MNEQEQFVTSDMTMCATLIFFGETLIDAQKNYRDEIEFIFNQSLDLENLIKAYTMGELSVEPRKFSVVLRDIKKIIFVQKNNQDTSTKN